MGIEIIHTAAQGTLVHGTSRGDGTNTILKAAGFRWFPTLGLWGILRSRDRQPNHHIINHASQALRDAGHTVEVTIDDTHRPTADAEADRAERQCQRVEALTAKADRRADTARDAWEAEQRAMDALPPGGEPIKIGHHSERRHRKAIERSNDATRRAIAATAAAGAAAVRADAATHTTDRRYHPVTVKNRIDTLEAEQRSDQRQLDGHRRVVARTVNHEYVDEFPPASGSHREQIVARMAQRADDIAYWRDIYCTQQAQGVANTYSRDTIAKGDLIKYLNTWYPVERVNLKSVSIRLHANASWTDTVAYHKIQGHRPAAPTQPHAAATGTTKQ
ncbi:hypothetical protein AO501_08370 [Mycobacterium gordonae]|uniref:DUF3560 domain-containing protein n=1 Tax=Mycobacterium gordonae TaxID=1778 RepID=A0A0Q2LVN4_MYCGO|nr:DUF3560 domain-containing protein [Mycobacterium gordonae]KQH79850.1 hypothetical protein AO501_08370 [Mycobacterium gordonae]